MVGDIANPILEGSKSKLWFVHSWMIIFLCKTQWMFAKCQTLSKTTLL
jgi:hypothetical protein